MEIFKSCLLFICVALMPGPLLAPSFGQDRSPSLILQNGHHGGVQKVAFTHDGKILISLGMEGEIRLWDADTGRFLYEIQDKKKFESFAINANGNVLATSQVQGLSFDYTTGASIVKLWNLKTRELIREFAGKGLQLAFSPDGKGISTGAMDVATFDVKTGTEKLFAHRSVGLITRLAYSANGNLIISSTNTGIISVTNASNGQTTKQFSDDQQTINSFALSPDNNLVFYANAKRMTLRTLNSGEVVFTHETENYVPFFNSGQPNYILDVAFSPNGKYLATAHDGGNVNILDAKTGRLLYKIQAHNDRIITIAFSPQSTIIASAPIQTAYDLKNTNIATIKFSDAATGTVVRDLGGFVPSIAAIALTPDEKALYASKNDFGNPQGDGQVDIWKLGDSSKLDSIRADQDAVTGIAVSPDGTKMATSGYGKSMKIWDLKTEEPVFAVEDAAVATFGSSDTVAIGFKSVSGRPETARTPDIEIRDLKTNTTVKRMKRVYEPLYSLVYSPDGKSIFASSHSNIEVWDVATATLTKRLPTGSSSTFGVAVSPDGSLLGSAGSSRMSPSYEKGIVELWNTKTWAVRPPMLDDTGWIRALAFNSDGRILATGGDGKNLILWDVKTATKIQTLNDPGVSSLAFSKHDNFLITGGVGGVRFFSKSEPVPGAVSYSELCRLVSFNDGTWVAAATDGRFDTNNLEEIEGLHWIMPDDDLHPLPLEIFMRDYYEPGLVSRLLDCEALHNCEKKFCDLPSLAELNRAQPKIEKITVLPQSNSDTVSVKVQVSSQLGQCLKDSGYIPCESGVYDLRLYRDGQLVGQSPNPPDDVKTSSCPGLARVQQTQEWRERSIARTKTGQLVKVANGAKEIIFPDIRLPRRLGVSTVEFTAYAFNEDRVKSANSEPSVYALPQPRPGVHPKAYVITVGVDFTSAGWRLGFARKGVAEIDALLQNGLKSQYEVVPVQLISAYQKSSKELVNLATRKNIQTVLSILSGRHVAQGDRAKIPRQEQLQSATPDDLVILYIASHGYVDPVGKFYVIPSDIGLPLGVSEESLDRCLKNPEQSTTCANGRMLLQHSISSDELTRWIEAIDAGQMTLILDSCHSGAVTGPGFKPGPMGDRSFGQLSYDKGMLVLVATQADNVDWGTLELGDRSLLTYALTQPRTKENSFDLRRWLSKAANDVPTLYERFVSVGQSSSSKSAIPQEPVLFDFSRKRSAER